MRRLSWTRGSATRHGAIFVSVTRFLYRTYWPMPLVVWHGLRLRRSWGAIEGAVGMFSAADLRARTTYTVSAWTSERALSSWLRSADHVRLMRDFKPHLESVSAASWVTDSFDREAAWREGLSRVR